VRPGIDALAITAMPQVGGSSIRGAAVGMTSPMLRDATSAARATGTREGVSCRLTSLWLAAENSRGGLLTEA
jgi:hypothetical protein